MTRSVRNVGLLLLALIVGAGAGQGVASHRRLVATREELDRLLTRGLLRAETERRLAGRGYGLNYHFEEGSPELDQAHGYSLVPNGLGFNPFPQHRFIRMTFTFAGDRLASWGCEDEVDQRY